MKIIIIIISFFCIFALRAYEVLVLGDLHYDSLDVRSDADKLRPGLKRELERNLERWQSSIPLMLEAAGKIATEQNVVFAVQLGDFIQGDCGSRKLQEKAFCDALGEVRKRLPLSIPFYPLKGNHDIRGKGAEEAYRNIMIPYLDATLIKDNAVSKSENYAFVHDKDLFILFDSIRPDISFLENTLNLHPNTRYVFFLTHIPVLPCLQYQPAEVVFWYFGDKPQERKKLLSLLSSRNAIVLSAHIHKRVFCRYVSPEGIITQLSSYSMPGSKKNDDYHELTNLTFKEYFDRDAHGRKELQNKKIKSVMSDYEGKISLYTEFHPAEGFCILKIDDNEVKADLHFGASENPVTKTITLFSKK